MLNAPVAPVAKLDYSAATYAAGPSEPTAAEFVQQAMDDFGITVEDDKEAKREEAAQWKRGGGAEADEVAQREAWLKTNGPPAAVADALAPEPPPADAASKTDAPVAVA